MRLSGCGCGCGGCVGGRVGGCIDGCGDNVDLCGPVDVLVFLLCGKRMC